LFSRQGLAVTHKNIYLPLQPAIPARLSDDGYVRMPMTLFREIPIAHLISALDLENPAIADRQTTATEISGYTEWISNSQPIITIGWDWWLDVRKTPATCVRVGAPRSNIMLLDPTNNDLGHDETVNVLGNSIDSFAWQGKTLEAIGFQRL